MGKPPAVVIVARHGARLDAADEQWQSNSQNPYDTPLSYGGWTQTRALGARIASLLHARDASLAEDDARSRRRQSDASVAGRSRSRGEFPPLTKGKRKTKVVLHTSPFLRCVQSSIAISAGMAQYHGNLVRLEQRPKTPQSPRIGPHSRAQTLDSKAFEEKFLGRTLTRSSTQDSARASETDTIPEYDKPILRIDACLGEWLSPDYYEFITKPPPSNMMVALAKAELLRSAEPIRGAKIIEPDGSITEFPSGNTDGHSVHRERPRSSTLHLDELARIIPGHGAHDVPVIVGSTDVDHSPSKQDPSSPKPTYAGYIPPTPTYAMLQSAPIPSGYVSHARDACVEIDFAWDSMREPQSWGDGGTYGEEWSAMHRRFRGGVGSMVNWYKNKGPDFDPQDDEKFADDEEGKDDDTDVVLVIMTHGAGCNALIGALTNQPVLMDIGMGSLTMAVHKPHKTTVSPNDPRRSSPANFRRRRRSSAVDIGLSEEYEMKLMASTEHLRAGPDPLVIPQLAHPGAMPVLAEKSRRGSMASTASAGSTLHELEQVRSKNSSLGSMRRTSVKSVNTRNFSPSPLVTSPTGSGLWGSRAPTVVSVAEDTESEKAEEEEEKKDTEGGAPEGGDTRRHNTMSEAPMSATVTRAPGLWGSAPPKEDSRRRYTVGTRR